MRAEALAIALVISSTAHAQSLRWSLAGGNADWPEAERTAITRSMDEAVALYNRCGVFEKRVTANYSPGVPTAQANYDGWIDFGRARNTRVALHELAHTLGVGTYRPFNGQRWDEQGAAGQLIKLYEGQGAVISTGGSHFWPYGLNYDNEDGPAARERHCKLVAALRFDMGIVSDGDDDGMPDDWERHHFSSTSADPEADTDGDGISNLHEYRTDSDPNTAAPIVDGHTYVLRSQRSGRVLTRDGDRVRVSEAAGEAAQRWTAHSLNDGWFRLESDDGRTLGMEGTDTASGRPLRLLAWSEAFAQQWRIVSGPGAEDGSWQIANRETGRVADCLDGAEGAPVQQYPFLGDLPQQFWSFEDVDAPNDAGSDAALEDGSSEDVDAGDEDAATGSPRLDGGTKLDAGRSEGARRDAGRDAAGSPSDDEPVDEGSSTEESAVDGGGCALGHPAGSGWLLLALALRRRRRT